MWRKQLHTLDHPPLLVIDDSNSIKTIVGFFVGRVAADPLAVKQTTVSCKLLQLNACVAAALCSSCSGFTNHGKIAVFSAPTAQIASAQQTLFGRLLGDPRRA